MSGKKEEPFNAVKNIEYLNLSTYEHMFMCKTCGGMVFDQRLHDEFHNQLGH